MFFAGKEQDGSLADRICPRDRRYTVEFRACVAPDGLVLLVVAVDRKL